VIPLLGSVAAEDRTMMGERKAMQDRLFYEFRLEEQVPAGHLLRIIDRFVDPEAAGKRIASSPP